MFVKGSLGIILDIHFCDGSNADIFKEVYNASLKQMFMQTE